jgi:hypothetical protein
MTFFLSVQLYFIGIEIIFLKFVVLLEFLFVRSKCSDYDCQL